MAFIELKTELGQHFVNTDHIIQIMASLGGSKWTVFTSRGDSAGSISIMDPDSVERLKELAAGGS